jgi:OTU domain-containing protein 6
MADSLEQAASQVVDVPETTIQQKANDAPIETLETLLARHRAEERDLNTKIINLRKTIPKNNKAKKREISSRISDMEYHLKQSQDEELRRYHGTPDNDDGISLDALHKLTVEEEPVAPAASPTTSGGNKKPNRAKLKKERREMEMQRLRDEAEKEAENQVDMGLLESESIRELLVPMKLRVQEVSTCCQKKKRVGRTFLISLFICGIDYC